MNQKQYAIIEYNRAILAKYKIGMNFEYQPPSCPDGAVKFFVLEKFALNSLGEVILGLRIIGDESDNNITFSSHSQKLHLVHASNITLKQLSN